VGSFDGISHEWLVKFVERDGLNAKDNFEFDRAVGYRQAGKKT